MVPLLAATSAVSAVSSLAGDAVAAWKDLTASRSASKPSAQAGNPGLGADGSAPGGFSALLSAQGVDMTGAGAGAASAGAAGHPSALQGGVQHGAAHRGGHHHVDKTA